MIKSNDYFENQAGFLVSSAYGFGLMDAGRMVEVAKTWKNVPKMISCHTKNNTIPLDYEQRVNFSKVLIVTDACLNTEYEVNWIEQVEITITINTEVRGNIELYLTSPSGTRTLILKKRPKDMSKRGFKKWTFKSVQFWGEKAYGKWLLEVTNFKGKSCKFFCLIAGLYFAS